uniref:replication initiator n=1 Tax=Actinomyces oris TaxID=544580 RepID=UPI0037C15AB1
YRLTGRKTPPVRETPRTPDYSGAVDFNGCAPRLFTRTTDALSDWLARVTGTSSARLSYVRVAEWQSRGLIHFHVLISLPPSVSEVDLGVTGADRRSLWSELDSQRASTLERICADVSTSSPSGRTLRWGAQLHADVIGSEQQAYRASGYMSKVINYVLKDVVAAGSDGDDEEMTCTPSPDEIARRSHIRRMSQAAHAWRCGRPGGGADGARHRRCCEAHDSRLQRSYRCRGGGHRSFGWHGRVFSTSRDWSPDRLSLTRCRRRRQDYRSRARGSVLGDSVVWRHASATSWSRDARRIRGEIERDPGTALAWAPPDPGSSIMLDGG